MGRRTKFADFLAGIWNRVVHPRAVYSRVFCKDATVPVAAKHYALSENGKGVAVSAAEGFALPVRQEFYAVATPAFGKGEQYKMTVLFRYANCGRNDYVVKERPYRRPVLGAAGNALLTPGEVVMALLSLEQAWAAQGYQPSAAGPRGRRLADHPKP